MLRVPVARVSARERRYSLTQPELNLSGQRIYSADGVWRLTRTKQLSGLSHTIGNLAPR